MIAVIVAIGDGARILAKRWLLFLLLLVVLSEVGYGQFEDVRIHVGTHVQYSLVWVLRWPLDHFGQSEVSAIDRMQWPEQSTIGIKLEYQPIIIWHGFIVEEV